MSELLTWGRFAQQLAYQARRSASWAGDALTLPENWAEPAKAEAVSRYIEECRKHLDWLERDASDLAQAEKGRG